MNLSKESFPGNDSIKRVSEKSIRIYGSTSSESSSASEYCCDFKPDNNSSRDSRLGKMKIPIFKQKAHSYQDLHTEYTKRRYQHVKSKVKEYIASITALDRPKSETKIYRHRSLPETISDYPDSNPVAMKFNSEETLQTLLNEKDKQVEELRKLNQHLEDNLQEKLTMLAKLKLNSDIMRIEFMEMKEKLKRSSVPSIEYSRFYPRGGSLPHTRLLYELSSNNMKSAATQTEFEDFNDSESFNEYYREMDQETEIGNYQEESIVHTDDCALRRRSFSNSIRYENDQEIDQSIDFDRKEDESNEETSLESVSDIEKVQLSVTEQKVNQKKRRISWQRCIAKPCRKVILCCSQIDEVENDFIYTKLPVEEIPLSSSI